MNVLRPKVAVHAVHRRGGGYRPMWTGSFEQGGLGA